MKKILLLLLSSFVAFSFTACDDDESTTPIYDLDIELVYPEGTHATEGVSVTVTSNQGTSYSNTTNEQGIASFKVPVGIYTAVASDKQSNLGDYFILNGNASEINITNEAVKYTLTMIASKTSQLILKELYIAGCMDNDNNKSYTNDRYVIIYNNSDLPASVNNLCLGFVLPFNSHATNGNLVDGKLTYESEGFIPAAYGIWYFQNTLNLDPYSEVVVCLNGAIDHTVTYSKSVNLANASYYVCYDTEDWNNTASYPAPYEGIATNQYLLAEKWGMGNAWPLSTMDPAFMLFKTEGITPSEFAAAADYWQSEGKANSIYSCLKVKTEWVIDAVEIFGTAYEDNYKRFTAATDAGAVYLTSKKGYTVHRHVDLEATKAIEGNEALLVYDLPETLDEANNVVSCDANKVNAVASAKRGAKLIYKDSNNSTNDFFERYQASLRD